MNMQLGLLVCGLMVLVAEGRHFIRNKHLCDLHVEITQENLKVAPGQATQTEIDKARTCRIPFAGCKRWGYGNHRVCCDSAKMFCDQLSRNDVDGPCFEYCNCWEGVCDEFTK